jgi:hypothetical protein
MGAAIVISQNQQCHQQQFLQQFSSFLPSYYTSDLFTREDLQFCSKIWIQLIDDSLPSPSSSSTPPSSSTNETLPQWMYYKLYNDLSDDDELHKCYNLHTFLQSFLQLIPICFHQFQTPKHFQKHFEYFGHRCYQVGLTMNHLNKFGSSFLEIIQQVDSDLFVALAWKKLFSSILRIVVPFLAKKSNSLTLSDSQVVDPSTSTALPVRATAHLAVDAPVDEDSVLSSLTMNPHASPFYHIPNSNANLPTRRFYTAMENIIL